MNKKFVAVATAVIAVIFGSLTSPAHADAAWISGAGWSNLHVNNENGVFENWHRDWKVVNPGDLFSGDHIDYNSPSQHNLAWVRTDRRSFTASYSGGADQANKQLIFTFQGYDENGDAMNFSVATPSPSASASSSAAPTAYPSPVLKTINGSPTYLATANVTTDNNGYAAITTTLNKAAVAYDSIVVSFQTVAGQQSATVGTPSKGKVAVTYSAITGATVYQYSLDGGTTWLDASTSPMSLTSAAVTQGVKVRGLSVVGPEVVTWQPAGWRPIIKLVGSQTGRQCDPYGNVPSKYLCTGTDFKDQTFDWSVANRPWFQGSQAYDYAQAYAKSYSAGCLQQVTTRTKSKKKVKGKYVYTTKKTCKTTNPDGNISVKYFVHDVWGTPIANLPLSVALQSPALTKWGNYPSTITTNSQGFASFSVQNLNSAAEVNTHVDINPDPPHVKTLGVLGFVVAVSSNETDEVSDQLWLQLVSDITVNGGYPNNKNGLQYPKGDVDFPIAKRGPNATDDLGNSGEWPSPNPALTLDPSNQSLNDVVIAALNLTRLKNLNNALLYAPNVTITASNGGLVALASAQQKAGDFADFKSADSFKSSVTFGYNYYQDLVFMGTKTGTTTWTVSIGKWSYSFSQDYVAAP